MKTTTIEMTEEEHGLYGLGKISYRYVQDNKDFELTMTLHDCDVAKNFKGQEAKRIATKSAMSENGEIDLKVIKRISAESCGIPIFRLKEPSRKEEVVFARYLVFWFANKILGMPMSESGKLLNTKNHTTVLHGIKIIKGEPKYLKPQQRLWRKKFMDELKEKGYIK